MTDEVLITVSGLQTMGPEDMEPIVVITTGKYYKKEGKHYLFFEEVYEGFQGVTKTRIRFDEKEVYLSRRGALGSRMVFKKDEKEISMYRTPVGTLMLCVDTQDIRVEEEPDEIRLTLDYNLELENAAFADCSVSIGIQAKTGTDFSLQ